MTERSSSGSPTAGKPEWCGRRGERMTFNSKAGGMVLAAVMVAAPAHAQDKLVHQEIDRNTKAVVKVFKTSTGGRIEVTTPRLSMSKTVIGERVVTRISEAGDELLISADDKVITVSSKAGRLSAGRTDKTRAERVRVIVAA